MKATELEAKARAILHAPGEVEWHIAVEESTDIAQWALEAVNVLEKTAAEAENIQAGGHIHKMIQQFLAGKAYDE